MADNFRMVSHRNDENLHIKLFGDFDLHSANRLVKAIKTNSHGVSRIIMHTSCVDQVSPPATEFFKKHVNMLDNRSISFFITGKEANRFVFKNCKSCRVIAS
ncbi:hypothetical protein ACFLZM_08935 [Thermodesulfobacteriota bacterium]